MKKFIFHIVDNKETKIVSLKRNEDTYEWLNNSW
jgi:ribosomal protein L24E